MIEIITQLLKKALEKKASEGGGGGGNPQAGMPTSHDVGAGAPPQAPMAAAMGNQGGDSQGILAKLGHFLPQPATQPGQATGAPTPLQPGAQQQQQSPLAATFQNWKQTANSPIAGGMRLFDQFF